ncbi:MAG: prefoldin subunit alpha [Candidatus Undinarchaeales archaeon]|jgi:prefoldin alpha subunit|nr:prefoldin subunit alpha [Candidatus Undinarchaeales archaeon]MDP7492662.1 prefoldin subunit alpha [Candidatus Undinarchaeales archaeon]
MTDPNAAEMQQRLYEIEILKERAQQIQLQLMKVAETRESLALTNDALERLKDLKKGSEALIPIGSGVYVYTKLEDTKKVMVNIGGVVGSRSIPDSITFIDKQLENLEKGQEGLEKTFNELNENLQQLKLSMQMEQIPQMM